MEGYSQRGLAGDGGGLGEEKLADISVRQGRRATPRIETSEL